MKGKDIAANLKKSRRKWGIRRLYNSKEKTYCVIGIKLAEAGVPLPALGMEKFDYNIGNGNLETLISLNDASASKAELVEKLESPTYRNMDFPIEKAVAAGLRLAKEDKLNREGE